MNLKISIGKTLDSKKEIFLDLNKDNIHTTIISGPTGSGKTIFNHNIAEQIMSNNTPEEVGFIFMDFKRIEFGEYKDSEYLLHPVIYDIQEAIVVLKNLIQKSEERYAGIDNSKKAIIVQIEECDIVFQAPSLLSEVWTAIDEQSSKNNIYILFSTSRPASSVITPEIIKHSALKGYFIPGDEWYRFYDGEVNDYSSRILGHSYEGIPKPWTRIFQLKNKKEIICNGFLKNFLLSHKA
ncbi:MAG: FtsK/SpoIIIE domain-containing protein [Clostridia bacterium]|nr:FtsK/SpoIIIE domain-containing protein [Clostridia bacterium]